MATIDRVNQTHLAHGSKTRFLAPHMLPAAAAAVYKIPTNTDRMASEGIVQLPVRLFRYRVRVSASCERLWRADRLESESPSKAHMMH